MIIIYWYLREGKSMSDMLCHLTFSPVIFEVRKEGSRAYITFKVKNRRFLNFSVRRLL